MRRSLKCNLAKMVLSLLLLSPFATVISYAQDKTADECRSLDIREFGLIADGNIGEPWTEAALIEKYGPPCRTARLGEVFIKKSPGKIVETGPATSEHGKTSSGRVAEKRQLIYSGDYANKTSIITVIDGVVVKKERVYE